MFEAHRALMGTEDPSPQQREGQMNARGSTSAAV